MKKLVISLALAVAAGNAVALPVTIDTDSYDIGTNVSRVDSNAWIQSVNFTGSRGFTYSDMYVGGVPTTDWTGEQPWDSVAGGFGSHTFARQITDYGLSNSFYNAHHYDWVKNDLFDYPSGFSFDVVGVRFFEPVQNLELRSLAGADQAYVWAYDMTGNLVASLRQSLATSTMTGGRSLQDLTITRAQADIAYVIYGGGGTTARLNQITYDVPAPASLTLLGIGLAFGGFLRTRRKLSPAPTI